MNSPINYSPLLTYLANTPLENWAMRLPEHIAHGLSTKRFGDLPGWYRALEALPQVSANTQELGATVKVGEREALTEDQWLTLEQSFKALIPWRKGPYELFGLSINTEWRSDWKWERLEHHITPLAQRKVLDVGCGNGYHCWRMLEAGAERVIGIDPSPRFIVQFYMIKHFLAKAPVDVLPLGIEALPAKMEFFDTTFSMGVLYHRRSPMDHLLELRDTLVSGGELVLETLVIDGNLGETLVPAGRYAQMNNVWFLPSVPTLLCWLEKCGFTNVRCVDVTPTSSEEQRSTEWMKFHSLPEFLDPDDSSKTLEGHPAPLRAIILANKG
ncbi:tRNA (mo5U34)-methyltransferase [Alteromonadaceae bacterium Bs31]|nr:tRNA (mo5U34)-methyltransferase [Alteromonadaceae bacterium Bs31]